MRGILSYGSYLPYFRLQRAAIAQALGVPAGTGARAVACFDEDSTSMAVEAGRQALATSPLPIDRVLFATATPPYLDKTNATAIHTALGLGHSGFAADVAGSARSGHAALLAGLFGPAPTLVVASDVRTGLPAGVDEREGGDGAVAFVVGEGDDSRVLAEHLGGASVTAEFLERWRLPGSTSSSVWEDRFGEHAYGPLVEQAVTDALKATGLTVDQVDRAVVTGLHSRAVRVARKAAGFAAESVVDDLAATVGNTGTAHPGLLLASVLDEAEPGQTIALVVLADGVDVAFFSVTDAIRAYRPAKTVAGQIANGRDDLAYPTYLTWRGLLDREPPARPDPQPPAAPVAFRGEEWKFALTASRCESCGMRHLPPQRVCVQCAAVDQMVGESLADVPGTIATFTTDRLAYSTIPPVVAAVVDFDEGGRLVCELTDVDPDAVQVGDRVEMTFRRMYTAAGVHNYFWKARPVREAN